MEGMIRFDTEQQTFCMRNRHFSYCMHLLDRRFLAHLYWGPPLAGVDPRTVMRVLAGHQQAALPLSPDAPAVSGDPRRFAGPLASVDPPVVSLDLLPQEYPAWGAGELRPGAFQVTLADGSEASRLEYQEHEILSGAEQPAHMGLLRGDHELGAVETLRIRLRDTRGDLTVDLYYLLAQESPALLRWTRFTNSGEGALRLSDPASASIDLPSASYDLVSLAGSWGRERHVQRQPLVPGEFVTGSSSGASSHRTSPFLALCEPGAGEHDGAVYAMALGYSGSFTARCRGDQYGAARLSAGVSQLRAHLEAGEYFESPEALLVFSAAGFNGMSAGFHDFVRHGVVPRKWREEPRKVVINSWEAMYFDVDASHMETLAREGREIGAELLVLDDGWFADRRDDTRSLGDWWPNAERFPEGLRPVAEAVRREGLEFGLWMEPEMVSPDSELYRAHPNWALGIPGREGTLSRNQLVLDLANPAVREHLFETISQVLRESTARYVKWDMNRPMTEAGSRSLPAERQGEAMHRYMLGLYELFERLTAAFPEVLFEACAGGGGRFDLGLARFSPRFWTSDQTDAVERLEIQYGTSLVFPPELMGAHVSTVPNHQVGRVTPAETRVNTALPFSFGFELDPARESAEDRAVFREGSRRYVELRERFATARFVRLRGPLAGSTGGESAWMLVTPNAEELFIFHFRPLNHANHDPGWLRLDGLVSAGAVADAVYEDQESGLQYPVAQLVYQGLMLSLSPGDYASAFRHLRRVQ